MNYETNDSRGKMKNLLAQGLAFLRGAAFAATLGALGYYVASANIYKAQAEAEAQAHRRTLALVGVVDQAKARAVAACAEAGQKDCVETLAVKP